MATKFASIPALPVGFSGSQEVVFAPGGQGAIGPYIQNYSHTFNIIAAGTMTLKGGDPVPSGSIMMVIDSSATVSCSGCQ
jgi:hypothetical protein